MIESGAVFSQCERYRYILWREWDSRIEYPPIVFIGLNPSTADETNDDPTMRRCMGFARRHECGRFVMLNLFAYRATDPRDMWAQTDPAGGEVHDEWLRMVALEANKRRYPVVAAWGTDLAPERAAFVSSLFDVLWCLGVNKSGAPRHPLYVKADTKFTLYRRNRLTRKLGTMTHAYQAP